VEWSAEAKKKCGESAPTKKVIHSEHVSALGWPNRLAHDFWTDFESHPSLQNIRIA